MNYKVVIYVLSMLASAFAVSSIDLNRFFKKNKVVEANVFAMILIIALAQLVSSFIINFLEVSKLT